MPIGDALKAFVPDPIPREVNIDSGLIYRLDEASRAVATLAGAGETIPNPHLLIRPFMRREAVLSSRIEGTQASLSDLFMFEASGVQRKDVVEVVNYIRALETGLELLDELPISLRLVNQLHDRLLRGVRGRGKQPGVLRNEQVWIGSEGTSIGEARFVPPPPSYVRDLMLDWEHFVNETGNLPPLIQCALMHYQFEAIHPYLDGNGRVGRLLIVLFLCAKQVLSTPLLYLSVYFESNRDQYYEQLLNVSATGNWGPWLDYFLRGVTEQSIDALRRVRRLRELQERYRQMLQVKRGSGNTLRLAEELFASPYLTTPKAADTLGITQAGARRILERLVNHGVLQEIEGTWPRLFFAEEIMDAIHTREAPQKSRDRT